MSVLNWTKKSALGSGSWSGAASNGSDLYVCEYVWSSSFAGPIVRSTDSGDSWTTVPTVAAAFEPYAICRNNTDYFVAVGDGIDPGAGNNRETFRRSNANVWSAGGLLPALGPWWDVASNGPAFCAVRNGGTGAAATSVDNGVTWTSRNFAAGASDCMICAHGSQFVVVNEADNLARIGGSNGSSWSTSTMPSATWYGVTSSGTRAVAVGTDKIAYSDALGVWTSVPVLGNWEKIAWNGTYFCAISATHFATSTNGAAWVVEELPETISPTRIINHGGQFVILSWDAIFLSGAGFVEFWTNEVMAQET